MPNKDKPKNTPYICPGGVPEDLCTFWDRPIANLAYNTQLGRRAANPGADFVFREINRCQRPGSVAAAWDEKNVERDGSALTENHVLNHRPYWAKEHLRNCTPMRHGERDNILFVDGHASGENVFVQSENSEFFYYVWGYRQVLEMIFKGGIDFRDASIIPEYLREYSQE